MFAIIETGGKQYQVETERYIDVELLDAKVDETVTFDKVVMVVDGDASKIGQPYVDGVVVTAKILKHDKDKKIIVYKQRRKKGYRKKQGHRQNFTRILIEDITGSKPKAKKAAVEVAKSTAVVEESTKAVVATSEAKAPKTEAKKPAAKKSAETAAKKPAVKKASTAKKPAAKKTEE
jgi:large subunit ribosomal protein L21